MHQPLRLAALRPAPVARAEYCRGTAPAGRDSVLDTAAWCSTGVVR